MKLSSKLKRILLGCQLLFLISTEAGAVETTTQITSISLSQFTCQGRGLEFIDGKVFDRIDLEWKPEYRYSPTRLRIAILTGHAVATGAALYGVINVDPNYDKARHVLAGYVIGTAGNMGLHLLLPAGMKHRELIAFLGGFGVGTVVGVAKEIRDAQGYGHPDVRDAIATAIGSGLGSLVVSASLSDLIRRVRHTPAPLKL